MLIAFFSDIHGNLPALQAAAADAKARGATRIICVGDVTGYGPFPNGVCKYLAANNIESIRGNYDRKVLEVIEHGQTAAAELQKRKKPLVIWAAKHLKKAARQFLAALPESIEIELPCDRKLLIVHGSPVSDDDDIYPSITAQGLKTKLAEKRMDVLVCGHTHIPFVKRVGRILIVNCGSAGQPVDGDPMPSYALLSVDQDVLRGRIIRFAYDANEVIKALKKTSLSKGLQKDFAEGTKRRFLQ